MSFEKLCLHNYSVCQEAGELQLAQVRNIFKFKKEKKRKKEKEKKKEIK